MGELAKVGAQVRVGRLQDDRRGAHRHDPALREGGPASSVIVTLLVLGLVFNSCSSDTPLRRVIWPWRQR